MASKPAPKLSEQMDLAVDSLCQLLFGRPAQQMLAQEVLIRRSWDVLCGSEAYLGGPLSEAAELVQGSCVPIWKLAQRVAEHRCCRAQPREEAVHRLCS